MASFTVNYPASVGIVWHFNVATIGGEVVVTGSSSSPPSLQFNNARNSQNVCIAIGA